MIDHVQFGKALTCVGERENENNHHNLWECHHNISDILKRKLKPFSQFYILKRMNYKLEVEGLTSLVCVLRLLWIAPWENVLMVRSLLSALSQPLLTHPSYQPTHRQSGAQRAGDESRHHPRIPMMNQSLIQPLISCKADIEMCVRLGCQEIEIFQYYPIIKAGRNGWSAEWWQLCPALGSGGNIWQRSGGYANHRSNSTILLN